MISTSESIRTFLYNRRTPANADLIDLWSADMETQVNVAPDGGEPIGNGRYGDGITTWGPLRIPRGAKDSPSFDDHPAPWPLDLHASDIGMSGWDWRNRVSKWVGFDIDDLVKHVGGVPSDTITTIRAELAKLDYVQIRRGTSGANSDGLHIYVYTNIPTANHDEHAALARAVLDKMARDTGLDLQASVDACGRILWVWSSRMVATSYEVLQ
jgi:hypothetical protein